MQVPEPLERKVSKAMQQGQGSKKGKRRRAGGDSSGSSSGRESPDDGRQQRAPKGATCFQCHQAKTKCCGMIPCTRCFRMNLPCRKRLVKKGASGSIRSGVDPTPIIDLVIETSDPRPFTEIYMQAFSQLYNEGIICQQKVLRMLRLWNTASTIMEGDLSWGVGARIAQAVGIDGFMLEDPEAIALDVPEHARKLRAQKEAFLAMEDTKRLKETVLFKMADDGIRGVYMDIKLRDRTSRATNSIYDQMHRSATDMTSDLVQRKTLVALLTASLVAPEDRFTYFRGMIEMLYAKVGRKQTHFFKLFSRDGEVRLYISEGRPITIDGQNGILCTLERVPLSKYITSRTDTHTVIDRFRHFQAPTPAPTKLDGMKPKRQRKGGAAGAGAGDESASRSGLSSGHSGVEESGCSGYSGTSSGASGSEGEEEEEGGSPALRANPLPAGFGLGPGRTITIATQTPYQQQQQRQRQHGTEDEGGSSSTAEAMMPFVPDGVARRKTSPSPPTTAAGNAAPKGLSPPRSGAMPGEEEMAAAVQDAACSTVTAFLAGPEAERKDGLPGAGAAVAAAAGLTSRSASEDIYVVASEEGRDAKENAGPCRSSALALPSAPASAAPTAASSLAPTPPSSSNSSLATPAGAARRVPVPAVACFPLPLPKQERKELLQSVADGRASELFFNRSKAVLAALPPDIAAQVAPPGSRALAEAQQQHEEEQQQVQQQQQQQQQQYLYPPQYQQYQQYQHHHHHHHQPYPGAIPGSYGGLMDAAGASPAAAAAAGVDGGGGGYVYYPAPCSAHRWAPIPFTAMPPPAGALMPGAAPVPAGGMDMGGYTAAPVQPQPQQWQPQRGMGRADSGSSQASSTSASGSDGLLSLYDRSTVAVLPSSFSSNGTDTTAAQAGYLRRANSQDLGENDGEEAHMAVNVKEMEGSLPPPPPPRPQHFHFAGGPLYYTDPFQPSAGAGAAGAGVSRGVPGMSAMMAMAGLQPPPAAAAAAAAGGAGAAAGVSAHTSSAASSSSTSPSRGREAAPPPSAPSQPSHPAPHDYHGLPPPVEMPSQVLWKRLGPVPEMTDDILGIFEEDEELDDAAVLAEPVGEEGWDDDLPDLGGESRMGGRGMNTGCSS